MNKIYKVISDETMSYQIGSQITANDLIDDYITHSYEWEDADTIGWLYNCIKNNKQDDAIDFITDALMIHLQEITI